MKVAIQKTQKPDATMTPLHQTIADPDPSPDSDPMQAGVDCSPECPVKSAADILSGKWTTLIVRELLAGTRRYSQLQYGLLGISPKILADRLRMLQANGLVRRKVYPTIPPKTEYTLTKLGREMEPVIVAMARFGQSLKKGSEGTFPPFLAEH